MRFPFCSGRTTARLLSLVFLAALCVTCGLWLPSCAPKSQPLSYQHYPLAAEVTFTLDGIPYSALISMTAPYHGSVTYSVPAELADICLSSTPEGMSVRYGELTLPLSVPADADFLLLLSLFSLQEEQLASATLLQKQTGNLLSFKTDAGDVLVTLDPGTGLPLAFHATLYQHDIDLTVQSMTYPGTEITSAAIGSERTYP